MRRTFKYKIKISKPIETTCNQWLEQCRILYNLALEQRMMIYKQSKKSISCYEQINQLPEFKMAFPEFKLINSCCLQDVLQRVDKAYQRFFARVKLKQNGGFPRFKAINRYNSFTFNVSGWKFENEYLYLPKIGKLKLYLSLSIIGKIKSVTIIKSLTGKWFVCFSCEDVPIRFFPQTDKEIGIDVGIKSFLVDSEGTKVDNPLFLKNSLKKLRRQQRRLSRRVRGSQGRKEARLLVAKTYEKITNQRNDFLHKLSSKYIKENKKIFIEDLNINGMIKNHRLAKSINDSSWGLFFQLLTYKAEEAGRLVLKVNPNGTSQRCSGCGEKVQKSLAVRIHSCPYCGLLMDRDENAALNIKQVGQTCQALTKADVRLCVA